MTFADLNLIEPITRVLKEKQYIAPTEVQAKAIPMVLQRRDVLACAQTGTGKTASFALPIIQLIYKKEVRPKNPVKLRALILTPTRELAIQISANLKVYSKYTGVKHIEVYGGVNINNQIRQVKSGAHILVATPGRLLDLMNQGVISLDTIKMFVLDEADRMLDMGFIHDIKKIMSKLPKKKQTLFFSATLPPNIIKLSKTILYNPCQIETARVSSTADTVEQFVYYTNRVDKKKLLQHILRDPQHKQVLIFTRTKHGADRVCRDLNRIKVKALAIHGNKAQNQRIKALESFKKNSIRVLVATDIAARGIDIQSLELVINYDIPNEPESYVHRIGRSGRAGNDGLAFSICEPEENAYMRDIEKLIGKKVDIIRDHPFPQTDRPMTAAEKKEWNKQKNLNKQTMIMNRRRKRARQ
ncbi:MAG: DEAD/DEAH box helicase [Saprospiraceae bacterium]|nr:DEAD/DEAH box helicase [Saprospiraceae bacterium]